MKRFLYIFTFAIGISCASFGQNKLGTEPVAYSSKFIRFYPNPASSVINFDFQKGYENNFSLLIFNFMGKKVYEVKNSPSRLSLNLEDFYRGIYVFQLKDKNGATLESGKFQVAK